MDELNRHLRSLGIFQASQEVNSPQPKPIQQLPSPSATTVTNPYGTIYLIHEITPVTVEIHSPEIPPEIQKWLGIKNFVEPFLIEDFLFVDVETSGAYPGAGVICFLVGIGQLLKNEIRLSQYLILHPEDELAQLIALEKIFLTAKGLMTYNGKSFDLPLLQSRFQFHQIPIPTKNLWHIDLLHLSRRFWKNHLPSRTLRSMEAHLLGIDRSVDDIPGWMIPAIYRDFLVTQDASFLSPVLYHNKMDVLSLVQLYLHIVRLFRVPLQYSPENAETLFSLAKFYQSIGESTKAIDAYSAGRHCLDGLPKIHLLENLADLHKKQKHLEEAVMAWQEAANLGSLSSHLELAKYYEHIKKDSLQAKLWVEAAMRILNTKKMDRFERAKWQSELQYRLERLNKSKSSRDFGKDGP